MITIEDIMTSRLHTLKASHTIQDANDLMKAQQVRHVPIVNDLGRLIGLVSQRDILASTSPSSLRQPEEMSASLTYIMTRNIHTINRSTSLVNAASQLKKHRLGCLPVVEDELLVGIVTDTDFVTIAMHLLEQLEAQEPEEPIEDFDEEFA